MSAVKVFIESSRQIAESVSAIRKIAHNFISTLPKPIYNTSKEVDIDPIFVATIEELDNYNEIMHGLTDVSIDYKDIEPFSDEEKHARASVEVDDVLEMYFSEISTSIKNEDVRKEKFCYVQQALLEIASELRSIDISHHKDVQYLVDLKNYTAIRIEKFVEDVTKPKLPILQNEPEIDIEIDRRVADVESRANFTECNFKMTDFTLTLVDDFKRRFGSEKIPKDLVAAFFIALLRQDYFEPGTEKYKMNKIASFHFPDKGGYTKQFGPNYKSLKDLMRQERDGSVTICRYQAEINIPFNRSNDHILIF